MAILCVSLDTIVTKYPETSVIGGIATESQGGHRILFVLSVCFSLIYSVAYIRKYWSIYDFYTNLIVRYVSISNECHAFSSWYQCNRFPFMVLWSWFEINRILNPLVTVDTREKILITSGNEFIYLVTKKNFITAVIYNKRNI